MEGLEMEVIELEKLSNVKYIWQLIADSLIIDH